MNTLLTWYRHTAWLGIVLNLGLLLLNGSPTDKRANVQRVENDLSAINSEAENKLAMVPAERQIGQRLIDPACTSHHAGVFKERNLNTNCPEVLTYSPTYAPESEAAPRPLYDFTPSKRTASNRLARYIAPFSDSSSTRHMVYKHLILPFAKTTVSRQE